MRSKVGRLTFLAALLIAAGFASYALADGGERNVRETLVSFEEVPALSSPANGQFEARIDGKDTEIRYRLSYADTESSVTQAHLHFENATNNGPIVVFLCTNLSNGPAGTQLCPAAPATITGTIRPADVSASAASAGAIAAGIGAGEFGEFVAAIRAGATYVNVHTTDRTGGEIRAQLGTKNRDRD